MTAIQAPKFEQIKRQLIADIESGKLRPGSRVASESELVQRHDVARMTVVRSLNELAAEGYLTRTKGKGTFVSERLPNDDLQQPLAGVNALVMPELRGGVYPSLIRGFEGAATEVGKQVLVCNSENDVRKQADIILQLSDKRVAGVAIVPATGGPASPHQIRQLQSMNIPVVMLHRGIEGASAPLIAMPYEEVGRLAASQLCAAGHRRIAAFFSHNYPAVPKYEQGIRQSLAELDAEWPQELIHIGTAFSSPPEEHEHGVELALERMVQLPKGRRPTAIFCGWDTEAALIYFLLGKLGVEVPTDIAIVTFGSLERQGGIVRRLATVAVDEAEVGRMAAGLLEQMARVERRIDDPYQIVIPLHFVPGETLGKD